MSNPTPKTASEQGDVLAAALEYHRRDWSIIPIAAGTKTPAKKIRWKQYQKKRPTEDDLRFWFDCRDDLGLGVILGKVSDGLVCRDFDVMEAYKAWAQAHPDLAKTLPTVATSRGRHVYFRANEPDLRFVELGDGEYRGDSGHYCVLPPSRHPDGPIYTWLIPLPKGPLPMVVDVVAAGFLTLTPHVTERTETTERTEDYGGLQRRTEAMVSGADRPSVNGRLDSTRLAPSAPNPPHGSVDSVLSVTDPDVAQAINDTLPDGVGRRNKQVFELARALKAIARLADAPVDALEPIVRQWHQLGMQRKLIGTEPFEETWIDFFRAWPKVKFPKGTEPMVDIVTRARTNPPPQAALKYEGAGPRLLTAICRELQRVSGDKPFYLGCRAAARLLTTPAMEVDHVKASRWLALLVHKHDLVEVEKGNPAKRQASRYLYRAD